MKTSLIVLLLMCFYGLKSYAQLVQFRPITGKSPGTEANTLADKEIVRVTGYILDDTGNTTKKLSLKVEIAQTQFGESIKIIAYYNVIEGFGANWITTCVNANAIGGQIPITTQQKVAYANFSHWARWDIGIIWFNL